MKKLLMALAIACSASAFCAGPDYYVALCAWAPGQIPSASNPILCGFRGTLVYGDCLRMDGLDLAIGVNRTRERFNGLAIALCYNSANNFAGMQLGTANLVDREAFGVQLGAWNDVDEGYGMQCGIVNTANYYAGFQCGLFNWANDLDGLQLGLVNVIADQPVCVLPFLNIGF